RRQAGLELPPLLFMLGAEQGRRRQGRGDDARGERSRRQQAGGGAAELVEIEGAGHAPRAVAAPVQLQARVLQADRQPGFTAVARPGPAAAADTARGTRGSARSTCSQAGIETRIQAPKTV